MAQRAQPGHRTRLGHRRPGRPAPLLDAGRAGPLTPAQPAADQAARNKHSSGRPCPWAAVRTPREQHMPHIQVQHLAGRSSEQKRELARELTEAYVRVTGIEPEKVWLTFQDVPTEDWSIGGTLIADRG
nr:4-oxalocrotonate tautomerase family protein [Streptacidiphilus sp. P02-A3a]